ncbi:MAG: hypothetical protein ACUVQ5_01470 [Candidatus Methanomethylicaceae archaeon]
MVAQIVEESAIINQTTGSVNVPARSGVNVTIQPSAGETWLAFINAHFNNQIPYSSVNYYANINTTDHHITGFVTRGNYGHVMPVFDVVHILTNTDYGKISYWNDDTAEAHGGSYGYSGFKLSKPLWTPKRLIPPKTKPGKLPPSKSLPYELQGLEKYAFYILDLDYNKPHKYILGIIFEEDTVLAVNEKTGFPVERLTVYTKADDLVDLIAKFRSGILNPTTTGHKKILINGNKKE